MRVRIPSLTPLSMGINCIASTILQLHYNGGLAQLARASGLHPEGRKVYAGSNPASPTISSSPIDNRVRFCYLVFMKAKNIKPLESRSYSAEEIEIIKKFHESDKKALAYRSGFESKSQENPYCFPAELDHKRGMIACKEGALTDEERKSLKELNDELYATDWYLWSIGKSRQRCSFLFQSRA